MLNFIREHAQGWIAWFIVGLITIPFALWGVNSYLNGSSAVLVAKVNGEPIKQVDLQRAIQRYRDQMRNVLGKQFNPALFEGITVKKTMLESLIEQKVIGSVNKDLGQQVADRHIAQFINATPAFQKDGKFDGDTYSKALARAGFTPTRYEAQLRTDLLSQQLTNNIQNSAFVSKHALNDVLSLEKQTRDIAYGTVSAQSFINQVPVSDDEIKQYYQANPSSYTAPEQVSVNYIRLSVDNLAKQVAVTDSELKTFYASNKNKFISPEQRRASHILITGDDAAALKKIKDIQKRLKAGENFAALAKKMSQDSGSAGNGGDLGYFQRGVMEPAFEKAAFALTKAGQISEPVKTKYGYHLIKLTDIRASVTKSFDEAGAEIKRQYRRQKAEKIFYDKAEKMADLSYENPESLDVAAESLGVKIQSSAPFTRKGGKGFTANKKVVTAAFSDDVLTKDLNSAVIELSKADLVVVHVKQHTAASLLPFASVSPVIKTRLKFEKASDKAREQGTSLLTKLKASADPKSLFTNKSWHAVASYSRITKDDKISRQILNHAFSVAAPDGKSEFTGFTAQNGNYIVVEVQAVHDGSPELASAEQRDRLNSQLMKLNGSAQLRAFISSLRANADIKIYQQNLN